MTSKSKKPRSNNYSPGMLVEKSAKKYHQTKESFYPSNMIDLPES